MQKVIDYLQRHESRYIEELCSYVRFPSVSAQPKHKADLNACAEWVVRRAQAAGLDASLNRTKGHPIVIAKTPARQSNGKGQNAAQKRIRRPHFVIYGHYDVQPAEPFELWKTPPFEPRIQGSSLFARGASDNKGQNLAHLIAVEAYLKTNTELPCDITFIIEEEEEVGSSSLATFLKAHRKELGCDAIVISDTGMPDKKHPALTYALRGIVAFEIILHGPNRDLHSGIFGGTVENPAMALSQMLGGLRNNEGKITIPGFYEDVVPLTKLEKQEFAKLKFDLKEYKEFLGVPELFGEKGYTVNEQRSARPTFEINGLTSGYQGEGSKTIIPSWARAKVTCRIVPNQDPDKIRQAVLSHLKEICPPTVRMEIKTGHGGDPYLFNPTSPEARAGLNALRKAFKTEPVLLREGGSIPIVNEFKHILGADTILLGLALPEDNAHSPNERFNLECFEKGMLMSAYLWRGLAKANGSR